MRHLGLLALVLSVCLLVSNVAQADVMYWNGTANWSAGPWNHLVWTGGAHWEAAAAPGPTDEARFMGDYFGSSTINVDTDVTVQTMTLSSWSAFQFTGSATINANTFIYATRAWGTASPESTMSDRLNLTGQFIGTYD